MPAVSRRWTASEVRQLIADNPLYTPRYELVDGELLVTPSPAPRHQDAVLELAHALRAFLGRAQARVYVSPSDVELEPEYWTVDLDARLVERWRTGDSRPDILTDRIEWNVEGMPETFVLELSDYFARLLD